MRIVIDTNIFISALIFFDSTPALLVSLCVRDEVILLSPTLLDEFTATITKKKLRKYFSLQDAIDFMDSVTSESEILVPNITITECRDPKDNHILELAVAGNAEYIITGDKDLLDLKRYGNIAILTPSAFLQSKAQ